MSGVGKESLEVLLSATYDKGTFLLIKGIDDFIRDIRTGDLLSLLIQKNKKISRLSHVHLHTDMLIG